MRIVGYFERDGSVKDENDRDISHWIRTCREYRVCLWYRGAYTYPVVILFCPDSCHLLFVENLLGFGTKLTVIGRYRRTGIRGYIVTGSIYVCYYLGWEYGKLSDVSTGRFRQISGRDSAGLQTESMRLFGICCIFIFPVDLKTDPVSIPVL